MLKGNEFFRNQEELVKGFLESKVALHKRVRVSIYPGLKSEISISIDKLPSQATLPATQNRTPKMARPGTALKINPRTRACSTKSLLSFHLRESSRHIVKFNLQTDRLETEIDVSSHSPRKNSYQWGGYSGMDLAVDEQGLWVLFGSTGNSNRLVASKIDVYKNAITGSWSLSTGMHGFHENETFISTTTTTTTTTTRSCICMTINLTVLKKHKTN